ncbi:MAG: RNA polymerase sigma factor [Planctomycetota bacterium]
MSDSDRPASEAADRPSPDADFDRAAVIAVRSAMTDEQRKRAWTRVFEVYEPMMRSLASRTLRSDDLGREVCHEAIIRAISRFDTFDDRARLGTWLFRVTYNACISRIRRDQRRKMLSVDEAIGGPGASGSRSIRAQMVQGSEPEPEPGVQDDEDRADVLRALDRLDPEQRGVLLLRDAQGLDYGRIAEVLGVARGTIKSRLFRARAALRAAVEDIRAERVGGPHSAGASDASNDPSDDQSSDA